MKPLFALDSFIGTVVQSAPQLATLVGQMQPTWHLMSLAELDAAFLHRHGIRGLIWDVDGTLTAHHATEMAPDAAAPFRKLLADPSLRHIVLSNANERRFVELGVVFPTIPVLRGYRCGATIEYRRVDGSSDSWSSSALAARLAAGARAIRKPSAELVLRAVKEMDCDPAAAVMVGDQYLTDVAGAGLARIRSIKLPTIDRGSFPLPVQLSQILERGLYRACHGPGTHSASG